MGSQETPEARSRRRAGSQADKAGRAAAGSAPDTGSTDPRQRRGRTGERLAAEFLTRRGYLVLGLNWRGRTGEIDIVAADGDTLVFVEVKLRRAPLDPLAAVGPRKQRQLARVATEYLVRAGRPAAPARFDVVAVDGDTLACTHVVNAFDCPTDR
jgi:putative endonuclease